MLLGDINQEVEIYWRDKMLQDILKNPLKDDNRYNFGMMLAVNMNMSGIDTGNVDSLVPLTG